MSSTGEVGTTVFIWQGKTMAMSSLPRLLDPFQVARMPVRNGIGSARRFRLRTNRYWQRTRTFVQMLMQTLRSNHHRRNWLLNDPRVTVSLGAPVFTIHHRMGVGLPYRQNEPRLKGKAGLNQDLRDTHIS